jgi:uncharacterized membrane protein YbhN (UPF0104 family)
MPARPKKKRIRIPKWLGAVIAAAMLVGAGWILRRELSKYNFHEVVATLGQIAWWRVALSLLFTALGFVALIAHDAIGLQLLRRRLALARTALAGFVAYAFSNSAPFSFAVAATLRMRYYSRWGLPARVTTRVVAIGVTTYALGLLTAVAIALTAGNFPMPRIMPLPFYRTMPVGILSGLILIGYLTWVVLRQRARTAKGRKTRQSLSFVLKQIAVSMGDWVMSSAALYVLIQPKEPLSFTLFFGLFILGQLVALVAQLPGGLGVFDAVLIVGLKSAVPAPVTLAALVAYRVIYFLLPLLIAAGILFYSEAKHVTRKKKR